MVSAWPIHEAHRVHRHAATLLIGSVRRRRRSSLDPHTTAAPHQIRARRSSSLPDPRTA